jgi:hypothetical protein
MKHLLQSKDVRAGLLLVGIGAIYLAASLTLSIGSAVRMGSGYFPMIVSGLLCLVGIATVFSGINQVDKPEAVPAWRSLAKIITAVILFGACIRGVGLIPAVMITALLSCWATGQLRLHQALITAVLLALFCWAVFIVGLGLALDPVVWPPFQ